MIIQKYNDYQINKYRKAMKIVDVFKKKYEKRKRNASNHKKSRIFY